jgi:hypothetical protein
MAQGSNVDMENQAATLSEETPLLNSGDELINEDVEEEEDPKKPEPSRVSWWLWRLLWFIVAALTLAAFIKGWIEAGSDVNVGIVIQGLPQLCHLTRISSST